jgi:D-alanine-D-alanine ligase
MGGPDAEREISIQSGRAVAAALKRAGWAVHEHVIDRLDEAALRSLAGDIVFPALHGPWGEGGPLQTLLESDGRPFVGSTASVAALCMDKAETKSLATSLGIATPAWSVVRQPLGCPLPPPVVIKPIDDGSSIDLHRCDTQSASDRAVNTMVDTRGAAMAERWITGRELTIGLVCGEPLPIVEILPHDGVYDYAAKYDRDDTRYIVDPPLDRVHTERMIESTRLLCDRIGLRHVGRVDFLLDEEAPWLLEVNTMPGFTSHSLLPMAASARGWDMPSLCDRLVRSSGGEGAS